MRLLASADLEHVASSRAVERSPVLQQAGAQAAGDSVPVVRVPFERHLVDAWDCDSFEHLSSAYFVGVAKVRARF